MVLYYFWVMRVRCPDCAQPVDLFPSYVFASNAYPKRKPEVRIVCPDCGDIFNGLHGEKSAQCSRGHRFESIAGNVDRSTAHCRGCSASFKILDAVGGQRPDYREYAKLVLTQSGTKEYLPTTADDARRYAECSHRLDARRDELPTLALANGFNTRQAMGYGFRKWTDLFNDRQLLALLLLRDSIEEIKDASTQDALFTLFSGVLEFNNMFASYKGEGTGAVRHMFSHHILKPERMPIEANVWGTSKSSGSFANLFKSRLLRALDYREAPTEVSFDADNAARPVCSPPFTGHVVSWGGALPPRALAVSTGDSAKTGLGAGTVDLVVTDPPFFDNVHYSELADFFRAWHRGREPTSTRHEGEVQDGDPGRFADKLRDVLSECRRVLNDEGMLVFSYHHSRAEGWWALAHAILGAGFAVINAHPVRSEMSGAAPKAQAKEPIQLDIIVVCRKLSRALRPPSETEAITVAQAKIVRLEAAGFTLSRNDRRIVFHGQLLTTLRSVNDARIEEERFEHILHAPPTAKHEAARRKKRSEENTRQLSLLVMKESPESVKTLP